jgi:GAF domain-containing protein/ActR/RegA family two-component response regulator
MSEPQLRVLVVDDEASLREPLASYLHKNFNYLVDAAASGEDAWSMIETAQGQYDVALIDDMLTPGPRGLEVMKQIKARYPDVEVIIFTAWGFDSALEALQAGAYRHIAKPFNPQELGILIRTAVEHSRMRKEKDLLRSLYEAGSAIVSTMEPHAVLERVVHQACQALGGWWAKLILIAEDGTPTDLVAMGPDHGLEVQELIRTNGISQQVLTTGQPRWIPDVQQELAEVNPRLLRDGVGAAVCVPLRLRGKNIGVMWIHYQEPRRFLPPEIDALQLYAAQAATAYDSARRVDELERMRAAAEAMTGADDLPAVLEAIVCNARDVLQADSTTIWSYDRQSNQFIPEGLMANGIPRNTLERFRKIEPTAGGTANTIMHQGWLSVADVSDPQYSFLGASSRDLLSSVGVQSFQAVTLKVGDEELGVLYVNYNQRRTFAEEDRKRLETFASHAALALKKTRLLDELDKARRAAGVVAKVTVLDDLERTLDQIVSTTQEILRCDAITLFSYEQERDEIGHEDSRGVLYPDRMPPLGKLCHRSALWKILTMAEPYYMAEDAQNDPVTAGRFAREEGIVSCISFPLNFGNHRVGALFVNYRSPRRFTESEITTISLFADQAAVAIRNAQLFAALQQRANALRALYEAGQKVSATLDLEQILSQIVLQSWKLAGQYGKSPTLCTIILKKNGKLCHADAYPRDSLSRLLQTVGREMDLEKGHDGRIGINGRVALTGQPVLIGDARQHPDYIEVDPETRAELAVPIKFGDRIIGVINVEHPDEDAFDEQDLHALESLAAQATTAIENARQYEELRNTYEELQRTEVLVGSRTALAWMGMISNTWRHAIEGYAGSIVNHIQMLHRELDAGAGSEAVRKRLTVIEQSARKIQEKPITPPISSEEGVESVSANVLIQERVQQLWQYPPYNTVQCHWDLALDEEVTVRASPEWLRRALDILIDNAVEAMAESPGKEITIATRQIIGRMGVTISDTGPGISPKTQAQLFQKPIDKPKGVKGLGMGLLMAQLIAQTYGGDIFIGCTGPNGTTMVLELPVEH